MKIFHWTVVARARKRERTRGKHALTASCDELDTLAKSSATGPLSPSDSPP
jgi:hypothetical protein